MLVHHPQLSAFPVSLSLVGVSKHIFALLPSSEGCCSLILGVCWPTGAGWRSFCFSDSPLVLSRPSVLRLREVSLSQ